MVIRLKKIILFLFFIPLVINAQGIEPEIKCSDVSKVNDKVSCELVINNDYNSFIKNLELKKNSLLLELEGKLEQNDDEKIVVDINSSEKQIKAFKFKYLLSQNDSNIYLNNIVINTNSNNYTINELKKNIKINNIAYADNILINNQPIPNFDKDIFNYTVNLYEKSDYIELKVLTSGQNKTNEEVKLVKYYNNNISFDVYNDDNTETYEIKIAHNDKNTNEDIKISEIPFDFDKNKLYYYLEVNNSLSKVTINNNTYNLDNGNNYIKIQNINDTYLFNIKKLQNDEKINKDNSIKMLKIGDSYINVREDEYEYSHITNKIEPIEVETTINQDYQIKYNKDKIIITVYDAEANSKTYVVNIIEDNEKSVEIEEYDKTKTMIIFIIFLLLFILLILVIFKRRKKDRLF